MRPDFPFRDQVGAVSQALVNTIDRTNAGIAASWLTEHTDSDTHGAITVESVTERPRTAPMGVWTDLQGATFAGGGAQTWTAPAVAQVLRYMLIGKTVFLMFLIQSTTVGGVPDPELQMTIPRSVFVFRGFGSIWHANSIRVTDNAITGTPGYVSVGGPSVVVFRRMDDANWAASAGFTSMRGHLIAEVV